MKPIKKLPPLWGVLLISLILVSGCFADNNIPQAPANQLIKGQFTIDTEWKTIELDKPLTALPHIQRVEILLDEDGYVKVGNVSKDEFNIMNSGYKQVATDAIIRPELILIDDQGKEFRATMKSIGYREVDSEFYNFLSYGTNSNKNIFYFPKDAEFVAIKLRSNVVVQAEYLYWVAPYYSRNVAKTWEDVKASKILDLK
ncbi:MAG: hypothetical protein ACRBCI_13225 [Cellvibrionaceae bacterium]